PNVGSMANKRAEDGSEPRPFIFFARGAPSERGLCADFRWKAVSSRIVASIPGDPPFSRQDRR
ncbi:MAG: hypothetical protein LW703_07265, partial [Rhodobacter sp.]|nr:hypothetical protein [Rhodobacter sp.]